MYQEIEALPASKNVKNTNNGLYSANSLISGVDKNIKSWFVNRYVFSNIQYSLSISEQHNFELSKKTFNLVDNKLSVKSLPHMA